MIPRVLHQTWKTAALPERFKPYEESWTLHNPGLERRFWTDRDLLAFVEEHYPELLDIYCAYPNPVMRADAARYMLLHHFGGVYADIDCECVASLEPLFAEDRIVFSREPVSHVTPHFRGRGLPHLLFNGMIASPPGHVFWREVLDMLQRTTGVDSVIDATGPCMVTGVQISHGDQNVFAIHPPSLFCPFDKGGETGPSNNNDEPTLAIHHWAGTWWKEPGPPSTYDRLRTMFYKTRHHLTRGETLSLEEVRKAIDLSCLDRPPPKGKNVSILVPARDCAELVAPFVDAVCRLDLSQETTRIIFCEGDSTDDTRERIEKETGTLRKRFRDVAILEKKLNIPISRPERHFLRLQRVRRSGLAAVRNQLIRQGLSADDDWALWIDIDVWRFPADVVASLIGSGRRIAAPHCVRVPGGPTFDMNSFVAQDVPQDLRYWRYFRDGLHQPPASSETRVFMDSMRYSPMVNLDGVGGCMLLVDAALHRGGLEFPEKPYRNLIETEGFGALANDLGVVPAGLPNVEVQHVPW